jgi:copper(I)-binding protein
MLMRHYPRGAAVRRDNHAHAALGRASPPPHPRDGVALLLKAAVPMMASAAAGLQGVPSSNTTCEAFEMIQSNVFRSVVAMAAIAVSAAAFAHGYSAGDVSIGHPFATPSLQGARTGAAYIATLENTGSRRDRLLRASTPVAQRVELHEMNVDANGVMRMRELDAIAVEPKAAPIRMRPGMGIHLMLIDLTQPLKEGDTFPMTLEFERAGKVEVKVVVQVPKERSASDAAHSH